MILIGMFDSPFVRRVAISMQLLGIPFEHKNWSVGKDFAQIRQYNPLGRVPTLVLDNGEALAESSAILDHIDYVAGPDKSLLPRSGAPRRQALQLMALAIGAAEKGVAQVYEGVFRPPEKRHQPWVDRCNEQMEAALELLDQQCARAGNDWLLGRTMTQADITVVCAYTFCSDALRFAADAFPALEKLAARCEALPAFQETRVRFHAPNTP
jgi:glutathione S-transferase